MDLVAAILIFNLKIGCKFSMGCAVPQQRGEFLISRFIIRQFPFRILIKSLCFHFTLSKMWKQDVWNFSQYSSWACLMDTFPIPALLSSDLPFQRTSAALGVPCSCLKARNNSERFLPTNPSIRNFSMPQRYKKPQRKGKLHIYGTAQLKNKGTTEQCKMPTASHLLQAAFSVKQIQTNEK